MNPQHNQKHSHLATCLDLAPGGPLFDTRIAGYPFYMGELYWKDIPKGVALELHRQPDHPQDDRAIEVYWQGHKLGYIPRQHNCIAAQLMDDGIALSGQVLEKLTLPGDWHNLFIRVDFA